MPYPSSTHARTTTVMTRTPDLARSRRLLPTLGALLIVAGVFVFLGASTWGEVAIRTGDDAVLWTALRFALGAVPAALAILGLVTRRISLLFAAGAFGLAVGFGMAFSETGAAMIAVGSPLLFLGAGALWLSGTRGRVRLR